MNSLVDSDIQRFVACLVLGNICFKTSNFLQVQQQRLFTHNFRLLREPTASKSIRFILRNKSTPYQRKERAKIWKQTARYKRRPRKHHPRLFHLQVSHQRTPPALPVITDRDSTY